MFSVGERYLMKGFVPAAVIGAMAAGALTTSASALDADGNIVVAGAHEDLVIYRARLGRTETIPTDGLWAGITQDVPPDATPEHEFSLEPGDVLVLYTDGVVEAMNAGGEQYGLERLCRLVEKVGTQPVADICEHINRSVLAHMREQKDDLTLLVTRYVGPDSPLLHRRA